MNDENVLGDAAKKRPALSGVVLAEDGSGLLPAIAIARKRGGYKLFRWTGAHRKLIADNMDKTDAELAVMIGVNVYRVQAFRTRQGLIKVDGGRFAKGNVPHNKGGQAPWAKTKCKATHFVKGGRPHTARPPGTIRAENHKGVWRLMICVEYGRAKPYARWLWEKEKGPIPPGHVVRIVNQKWDDVRIDNLVCITREHNGSLNITTTKEARSEMMRKAWKTRRLNEAKKVSQPYNLAA